jgi:protein SCO1/2
MKRYLQVIAIGFLFVSCSHQAEQQFEEKTLHYQAPEFKSTNQNGDVVSNLNVKGKIYVVDFFFTTCPTICPVMTEELTRVYQKFESNPNFMILSHTIDPDYDTYQVLQEYSKNTNTNGKKWMFLRANRDSTIQLANNGYYAALKPEFYGSNRDHSHSGGLFLVDQSGQIRGIYYGTVKSQVDQLINDIEYLLNAR